MKSKSLFSVVVFLVLVSMTVAACTPATPTTAPVEVQPTAVPVEPTAVPAQPTAVPVEPVATFEGMVQTAPDCDYGGLIKEIAAIDELTVQFTMCVRTRHSRLKQLSLLLLSSRRNGLRQLWFPVKFLKNQLEPDLIISIPGIVAIASY